MAQGFYPQKITSGDKTEVTYDYNDYSSMTFTNTHTSAITMSLYVTSQLGSSITNTNVKCNDTDGIVNGSSVTLTVDTTDATDDALKNERVYKSDGTFFGVCSSVTNTTTIVFTDGLTNAIANNDDLYTGTRYTILNEVVLPVGASLQLHPQDFNFNSKDYKLYINSSHASGLIDIITRY
tara:strand:+ start:499 stop:1038 length:540 start_codon:yes stop_codon:yes gene_type:complete